MTEIQALDIRVPAEIAHNWGWFLAFGIGLVVLGVLAVARSVAATVVSPPRTRTGGHVLLEVRGRQSVTVAAYEPSKQFRAAVLALRPGDRVRVWGSVRQEPRTLNLEKLRVVHLSVEARKLGNPRCPRCGKSMKSMGHESGYRCARCRSRAPAEAAPTAVVPRGIALGLYEPPVSARRHLAKPGKRMTGRDPGPRLLEGVAARG